MNDKLSWQVFKNKSLLLFLSEKLEDISKKEIKRLIENGLCFINDKIETFSTKLLKNKDVVCVFKDYKKCLDQTKIKKNNKLKIIYEDDDFYIIDKPINITCSNDALQVLFQEKIFLVHRLDKKTSGALIIAKNEKMQKKFEQLFLKKEIKKTYLAIVDGTVKDNNGKVKGKMSLKKKIFGQNIYHLSKDGKISETNYACYKSRKDYSVLICFPITGRTHQIRVHLSSIDHPILGDYLYSNKFVYPKYMHRLFLHAIKLEFVHPLTNKKMSFFSKPPIDFSAFFEMSHFIERFRKDK
jgi:RluA family pseudouridine synthase